VCFPRTGKQSTTLNSEELVTFTGKSEIRACMKNTSYKYDLTECELANEAQVEQAADVSKACQLQLCCQKKKPLSLSLCGTHKNLQFFKAIKQDKG